MKKKVAVIFVTCSIGALCLLSLWNFKQSPPIGIGNDNPEYDFPVEQVGSMPVPDVAVSGNGEIDVAGEMSKSGQLEKFVGVHSANMIECDYRNVTSMLTSSDVPRLREMLKDSTYRMSWGRISHMIAWLSEEDDRESVDALLEYIQRLDVWSETEEPRAREHLMAKAHALRYLGLFDTENAMETLRGSLERDGARELIEAWVDYPYRIKFVGPENQIVIIQGYAAKGLVYSRNSRNIDLVERQYETYRNKVEGQSVATSENPLQLDRDGLLYTYLADALAESDLITDIGLESFLELEGDATARLNAKWPYLMKYGKEEK